jgi:hypothetical protein
MEFDEHQHRVDVTEQLLRLLPEGSLALKMKAQIGLNLSDMFRLDYEPDFDTVSQQWVHSRGVVFLFNSLVGGFTEGWEHYLHPGNFVFGDEGETGDFLLDDDGNQIRPELWLKRGDKPAFTPVELLAIYGLHFIENEIDSFGAAAVEGQNEQGFDREKVLQHRASCVVIAYQALAYSRRLSSNEVFSDEELAKAAKSALAMQGANASHRRHREMKERVFSWCDEHPDRIDGKMDEVAFELAGSLVHLAFATVRGYLTQWKKLRAAGTR